MATTYTLISSNVLTSSAASVTFSAIPSTYTDLVLRVSARCNEASVNTGIYVAFNGDYFSPTTYSDTYLSGNGATASSGRTSANTAAIARYGETGSTATASTFGSTEIYIPSYTVAQNKPIGIFSLGENNATTAYIAAGADLWRNTAAITQVALYPNNLGTFDSGSSFYLYGIKNS